MISLMKNAIEAMSNYKENKSISIAAERVMRYVNLSLADTGCGIAQEDLEQIFIPFLFHEERRIGDWPEHITTDHAEAARRYFGSVYPGKGERFYIIIQMLSVHE